MEKAIDLLKAQISEMDVETTRIAEYFSTEIQKLKDGQITPEQLEEEFEPQLVKLRALGQPA